VSLGWLLLPQGLVTARFSGVFPLTDRCGLARTGSGGLAVAKSCLDRRRWTRFYVSGPGLTSLSWRLSRAFVLHVKISERAGREPPILWPSRWNWRRSILRGRLPAEALKLDFGRIDPRRLRPPISDSSMPSWRAGARRPWVGAVVEDHPPRIRQPLTAASWDACGRADPGGASNGADLTLLLPRKADRESRG